MVGIGIVIGVLLVGGIVFVLKGSLTTEKTNEQFIAELSKYLDGNIQKKEGEDDYFQVYFNFEGRDCVFDWIKQKSFIDVIEQFYLKSKTSLKFNLNFTEKQRKKIVKNEVLMASDISTESTEQTVEVNLPRVLENFDIYTDNKTLTNHFLGDSKVVGIFKKYMNINVKGYPIMSLKILDGEVVLKFHSTPGLKPDLNDLMKNVPSIEYFLDDLLFVAEKLEKLA